MSRSVTPSFFFLVGFKLRFLSINGDWVILVAIGVGVGIRVGISCGWDWVKRLLLVFVKAEENIFNDELDWEVIPNGSTWKVEPVAGG